MAEKPTSPQTPPPQSRESEGAGQFIHLTLGPSAQLLKALRAGGRISPDQPAPKASN
jgi:hypothetical protein